MRHRPPFVGPIVLLLVLFHAGIALAQARPSAPRLNDDRIARLDAGEKLTYATIDDMNRGEVVGVVDASVDEVLAVLRDYDNYMRWYPDQRAAELLWRRGNEARARGEIRMPFPFPNRRYDIDVRQQNRSVNGVDVVTVTWQYVEDSGNFREMYGFWWIQPWQDNPRRTLLRYVLYADLGTWLPDGVIRWAQRRMLPGIIDGIREEVARRR
ncbi:MAG: hypothetical protein EA398_09350 [Deltaproteobacteria bacterium]|nr:MAG: hypothetical protein EA398_09350 [Deltaproteobacteria bacterium]